MQLLLAVQLAWQPRVSTPAAGIASSSSNSAMGTVATVGISMTPMAETRRGGLQMRVGAVGRETQRQ